MKRACPFDANLLRQTKVHLMDYHVDPFALKKLHADTIELLMNASRRTISEVVKPSDKPITYDMKKSLKQTEVTSYFTSSGCFLRKPQAILTASNISEEKCSYCDVNTQPVSCNKCGELFCESCSFASYGTKGDGQCICVTCS